MNINDITGIIVEALDSQDPAPETTSKTCKNIGMRLSAFSALSLALMPWLSQWLALNPDRPLPSGPALFGSILVCLLICGTLLVVSARGIRQLEFWGKILAQATCPFISLGLLALFGGLVVYSFFAGLDVKGLNRFLGLMFVLGGPINALTWLALLYPAAIYTSHIIKYLGRLPIKNETRTVITSEPELKLGLLNKGFFDFYRNSDYVTVYSRPGLICAVMIFVLLILPVPAIILMINKGALSIAAANSLLLLTLTTLAACWLLWRHYRKTPSLYEKNRKVIKSFMYHTWYLRPMWDTLLVYEDGIEIRLLFLCISFFMPYEKLNAIIWKRGRLGLNHMVLFKFEVEGRPCIWFYNAKSPEKVVEIIQTCLLNYRMVVTEQAGSERTRQLIVSPPTD